jgi:uncharacterized protein (DUF302 family)/uncharacterized membrane protein YidH (DUF202 family)
MPERDEFPDYLALERTFLAWVRTGLALMGFGFVVARFGLFLRELQVHPQGLSVSSSGLSVWFGTALILLGVVVNVLAAVRHRQLVRQLDEGEIPRARSLWSNAVIALILALIGVAMAVDLLSVRSVSPTVPGANKEMSMEPVASNGIVRKASKHSVDETVAGLKGILQSKGVTLFATIDHSGEAEKAGLKMPNTKLLIFGSPKAGTPLMLAAPSVAIDLPLKILVSEDEHGRVWVSYNSPGYLGQRHGLPPELLQNIAVVETLAAKAGE